MPDTMKKLFSALAILAIFLVLVIVLVPEGYLACAEASAERSPDGRWTLHLCRRPLLIAMPGGSSDAPAWIVLRDEFGAIRGVSSLGMIQNYGDTSVHPTQWTQTSVARRMTVELALVPAPNALMRWLTDRCWRIRAWLGLTPSDDDFH
jgi:hypothetical protein